MLARFKKNTNIGVGIGVLLQIIGRVMLENGMEAIGPIVVLFGLGRFHWGCAQYAEGKGYSPWFGTLGLLSIFPASSHLFCSQTRISAPCDQPRVSIEVTPYSVRSPFSHQPPVYATRPCTPAAAEPTWRLRQHAES